MSKQPQVQGSAVHNLVRVANKISRRVRTAQKLNNKLALSPEWRPEKIVDSPEVLQRLLKDWFKNSNARILVEIEGDGSVGIYVCDIKEELIEKTKRSLQEYVEKLLKHYNIINMVPIQYHAGPYCMEGWGGIH